MKKTMIVIFATILFSAVNAQTQSTSAKLTKQDSINAFVKLRDAFIDTVLTKTSLKDFQKWLDESVSGKMAREGIFTDLYIAFLNAKVDEWVVKKKIVVPRN